MFFALQTKVGLHTHKDLRHKREKVKILRGMLLQDTPSVFFTKKRKKSLSH
jgi:hypothetical protein